jgi:hypothetical protein
MPAYLLTWNPERWAWPDLRDQAAIVRAEGSYADTWSVGSRQIAPGDHLYLIRLGRSPRGIIASGVAASEVYVAPHWDERREGLRPAHYIDLRWDVLLDAESEPIFPRERLKDQFPGMQWDSRMSGVRIPDSIAKQLAVEWAEFLSTLREA